MYAANSKEVGKFFIPDDDDQEEADTTQEVSNKMEVSLDKLIEPRLINSLTADSKGD